MATARDCHGPLLPEVRQALVGKLFIPKDDVFFITTACFVIASAKNPCECPNRYERSARAAHPHPTSPFAPFNLMIAIFPTILLCASIVIVILLPLLLLIVIVILLLISSAQPPLLRSLRGGQAPFLSCPFRLARLVASFTTRAAESVTKLSIHLTNGRSLR